MKIKNLFVFGFTALTLFSCSNSMEVDEGENHSLALSISTRPMVRSIEKPTDIKDIDVKLITIELYDADKRKLSSSDITDAVLIAAVTNPTTQVGDKSRIILSDISNKAEYVKIMVYQTQTGMITDLSGSINHLQKPLTNVPFTAITGSINNLLVDGELITINKTTTISPETGRKVWTVEAAMAPSLARFEITGNVKAQQVSGGAWADIVVTGVYMNNLRDVGNSDNIKLFLSNHQDWGSGDWAPGHPYTKPDGLWSNLFDVPSGETTPAENNSGLFIGNDVGKVAAYMLFSQGTKANSPTYEKDEVPHIILRLKVTPKAAIFAPNNSTDPFYGFVTLRKFKIEENGALTANYVNRVERGKIYRIDLSNLTLKPEDIDPDPEHKNPELSITLTIQDWTNIILKPNL